MKAMQSFWLIVPALAYILPALSWAAHGKVEDQVAAAWRARDNQCTSFKITWKETQTFVKGSLTNLKTKKVPNGALLPAETMETQATFVLCANGDKMKEIADTIEITETMEMKKQKQTTVFNGTENKCFRPAMIHDHPQGYIGSEKFLPGMNVYNLRPLLVPLRPLRYPQWGYYKDADLLANYHSLGPASLGGIACIVLRENAPGRAWRKELWLDPKRGYIPLREVTFARDKAVLQLDWEEYRQEGLIWVPLSWKIQELGDTIKKNIQGKVLECTINQPLAPEEFDLEFPPGTWVIDRRTKDSYGNPTHYIVTDSGKRPISLQELSTKSYGQLYPNVGSRISWRLLLAIVGVVLVAGALFYYLRRKYVQA